MEQRRNKYSDMYTDGEEEEDNDLDQFEENILIENYLGMSDKKLKKKDNGDMINDSDTKKDIAHMIHNIPLSVEGLSFASSKDQQMSEPEEDIESESEGDNAGEEREEDADEWKNKFTRMMAGKQIPDDMERETAEFQGEVKFPRFSNHHSIEFSQDSLRDSLIKSKNFYNNPEEDENYNNYNNE